MNFWNSLSGPIVGLSPMDGVTDAPFRFITAKYGHPDVIFTEFVPVEAITHNAVRVMPHLLYSEIERPVVAQVYGVEPESFYKVAHVVCEMGFDGIDINMGCPAKNVVNHGCGAGLINDPPRAKAIVRAVQRGVKDWVDGSTMERVGIPAGIVEWVQTFKSPLPLGEGHLSAKGGCASGAGQIIWPPSPKGEKIPVSIKTRIGYSENIITDWVKHLLEVEPVAISIHGRTLKQMYRGDADWEAIARATEIIRQTPTLVLGNGDIKFATDAVQKIRVSGVDGVLIGRAACGNPWIFGQKEWMKDTVAIINPQLALQVMLEHARTFEEMCPDVRYVAMRKHIAWYAHRIPELRRRKKELMQVNSYAELKALVMPALNHTVDKPASSTGSPQVLADTGRG